jgi:hypothetical protein
MAANEPVVFIRGIDKVIRKDLEKHKTLLARTKVELHAYREARSHEVKKRKHYSSLIGGEKYDDKALRESMGDIAINIRHMSDKVKLAQKTIEHHTEIVDTLTQQLADYDQALVDFTELKNASGN